MPGLDFSKFMLYKRDDGDIVFADKDNGIIIDALGYAKISEALCTIHKIKKKVEKAGNAFTKKVLIDDDEERHRIAKAKHKDYKPTLLPLISSAVNREGFKYDYSTIRDLMFGQFMDSIARLQMIVATDQLVAGIYAGNVDAKRLIRKSWIGHAKFSVFFFMWSSTNDL